jgi:hypothetical protein
MKPTHGRVGFILKVDCIIIMDVNEPDAFKNNMLSRFFILGFYWSGVYNSSREDI